MTTYNPIKAGQKIKVQVQNGCEIVINRPDGTVDVVANPGGFRELNPVIFARIKAAAKTVGRGDVVSYKNHKKDAVYVVTAADAATDSTAQINKLMGN